MGFTESGDLSDHRGEQSGEKPFHCEICPMVSTESGDLSDHRGEQSGEKPFHCEICPMG